MTKLINERRDRLRLLTRVKECVSEQPLLLVAFTAYWVWVNMLLQTPMLFPSLEITSGFIVPLRLAPICASFLTYLVLSFWFRKTRFVIRSRWYIPFLAVTMIIGGLLIILWMETAAQPTFAGSAIIMMVAGNTTLVTVLYLIGALLVGIASACLCIEFQRVFGTLGSQYVLYIGCLAVVLSCVVLIPCVFLPQSVMYLIFLLMPLVIAVMLPLTVKKIATKTYFTHGLTAKLVFPRKLILTSALHGLSIGVLMGFTPVVSSFSKIVDLQSLIPLAVGALCLLVLSILVKMDYNHLLYQVGFPLVGLGALCLVCLTSIPAIGVSLQLAGFCFIHLVMWGVCTYFIKNLNLPATWTIGISTCGFMLGQLVGAVTSVALSQTENAVLSSQNLAAVVMFIVLLASLLMMSSTNLKTGWGLAGLDPAEHPEAEADPIIDGLVAEFLLTERQTSILLLLIRGRNRRIISKELFISEETVKTHVQQIYRKLSVHSRQELIDLYEKRGEAFDDSVPKPLFTTAEPESEPEAEAEPVAE